MQQGGVTSRFRLVDVDKVDATMTITMTMERWKALRSELPRGQWAVQRAIDELVGSAEKEFYHREEEVDEPKRR